MKEQRKRLTSHLIHRCIVNTQVKARPEAPSYPLTLDIDDYALSLFDAERRTHRGKVSSVEQYALATIRSHCRADVQSSLPPIRIKVGMRALQAIDSSRLQPG